MCIRDSSTSLRCYLRGLISWLQNRSLFCNYFIACLIGSISCCFARRTNNGLRRLFGNSSCSFLCRIYIINKRSDQCFSTSKDSLFGNNNNYSLFAPHQLDGSGKFEPKQIRVFNTHFLCYFFSNFCTRFDYFRNFKSFRSSIFACTLDATCCGCILWMVFSKRVIKPYANGWGINSFGGYLFSF